MKIALVQFQPVFKDVNASMKIASELLLKCKSKSFDLVILPEMSFTGYCFTSKQEIKPFIDNRALEWASEIAINFSSFVQVGFPRQLDDKFYNSTGLVDRTGKITAIYDKHFLYEQDEYWADEGDSFKNIQTGIGRIGFGICMDLNPKQFKAPFDKYEFANYHLENNSELLVLSMAWLHSTGMHQYWANRLFPIINSKKRVLVAICNRIGNENGILFGGSSVVLLIEDGNIYRVGCLSSNESSVLEVSISL
jgi:protein N-terminal amidase